MERLFYYFFLTIVLILRELWEGLTVNVAISGRKRNTREPTPFSKDTNIILSRIYLSHNLTHYFWLPFFCQFSWMTFKILFNLLKLLASWTNISTTANTQMFFPFLPISLRILSEFPLLECCCYFVACLIDTHLL